MNGASINEERACPAPEFIPIISLFLLFFVIMLFFSLVCLKDRQKIKIMH